MNRVNQAKREGRDEARLGERRGGGQGHPWPSRAGRAMPARTRNQHVPSSSSSSFFFLDGDAASGRIVLDHG